MRLHFPFGHFRPTSTNLSTDDSRILIFALVAFSAAINHHPDAIRLGLSTTKGPRFRRQSAYPALHVAIDRSTT